MGLANALTELAKHSYFVYLDNSTLIDFNPWDKGIGDYIACYRAHSVSLDFISDKMNAVLGMAAGVAGDYKPPLREIVEARNKGYLTEQEAAYEIKRFMNDIRTAYCYNNLFLHSFYEEFFTKDEIIDAEINMDDLKKIVHDWVFSGYLYRSTVYRYDYWNIRSGNSSPTVTAQMTWMTSGRWLLPHLSYTPSGNPFLSFKQSRVYISRSQLNFNNDAPLFFVFTGPGGEVIQYNDDESSYGEYPYYSEDYDIREDFLLIINRKPKNSKDAVVTKKCFVRIKPFGVHLKTLFQTAHHLIQTERKFNVNLRKTFMVEFCESALECLIKLLETAIINTKVAKLSPSVETNLREGVAPKDASDLNFAAIIGSASTIRDIQFVYGENDSDYETKDLGFNYQCPIANRVITDLELIKSNLMAASSAITQVAGDYVSDVARFSSLPAKDKTQDSPIEKARVKTLDKLDKLFFDLATERFDVRINDFASWDLILKLKPGTYYIL